MWTTNLLMFIHYSATARATTLSSPLPTNALIPQPSNRPFCSLKNPPPIATRNAEIPRNPSRRAFLLAAVLLTAHPTAQVCNAASAVEQFETFTFNPLNVVIEYPKSWFRSERKSSLVIVNLKEVIAATVSRKALRLEQTADAFSAAYDMVKDRIEEEGSELILKEASFDEDGALVFRFQTDTLQPNGDVVRRVGVARGVAAGNEAVVCIVTGPMDGWGGVEEVATRVVRSLRVI